MNNYKITWLLLLSVFFTYCGNSPEKARKELHTLGVDFKTKVYEDHVEESDFVVVKLFLDAGMPPNSNDALITAIYEGNYEMVKLLVKYGADPNTEGALLKAIYEGNFDIVKLLIKKGVEVDKIHEITWGYNTKKELPIVAAIEQDEFEIAKFIAKNGGKLGRWKRGDIPLKDIYVTDELKEKDWDLYRELKYDY